MFTTGFIKIANQVINMKQVSPGVYKPAKPKSSLRKRMLIGAATGLAAGAAMNAYKKHSLKKKASDMKMGPPKGKKETPEEKKIREQAEMTSLGC